MPKVRWTSPGADVDGDIQDHRGEDSHAAEAEESQVDAVDGGEAVAGDAGQNEEGSAAVLNRSRITQHLPLNRSS